MIVVIDYGMGNLHSVRKALEVAGARVKVSSMPADIKKAEKIVFPGVGAFGEAMKELGRRRLVVPIKDAISTGKPFLGLCLGLQLLFEKSGEAFGVKGLGVLKGEVRRFRFASCLPAGKAGVGRPAGRTLCLARSRQRQSLWRDRACEKLKVPHMGWNQVSKCQSIKVSKILQGIPNGSYMYFVHSYYVVPADKRDILTTTDYGMDFVSGIRKDNIYAFQFHPEKSQEMGLKILKNFVQL